MPNLVCWAGSCPSELLSQAAAVRGVAICDSLPLDVLESCCSQIHKVKNFSYTDSVAQLQLVASCMPERNVMRSAHVFKKESSHFKGIC